MKSRVRLRWLLILIVIGIVVWLIPNPGEKPPPEFPSAGVSKTTPELSGRSRAAVLYIADKNHAGLLKTPVEIETEGANEADLADVIVKKIFEGSSGLYPPETAVREIFFYEDVAVISLDGSFRKKFDGGAWTELLAVYGIVNTVAESFEKVKRVRILIDEKEQDLFVSHVDIEREIAPDFSFVLPEEEAPQ